MGGVLTEKAMTTLLVFGLFAGLAAAAWGFIKASVAGLSDTNEAATKPGCTLFAVGCIATVACGATLLLRWLL